VSKRPRSLQALFDTLSASHFDGRLSGYSVRRLPLTHERIERLNASRRWARTMPMTREIRISGALRLRPELERRVLLHEMCHAATEDEALQGGGEHGSQWRGEMYRLAREHGEAWAEKDAQRFEREQM
jgi:SprT-like family